jgi:succinoglycan biosynthesis transport protein ExoP
VDADLRNPTLTGKLAPHQRVGLSDVLAGKPLAAALVHIEELHCDFLPAVRADIALGANEFTSAAGMRALKAVLEELKAHYEYVILDLPPLIPVIDARAAADVIDAFVMVVEWGKTSANSVQLALQASSRIQGKTVGVALNKVDTIVARRYYDHEYPSAASAYYSG